MSDFSMPTAQLGEWVLFYAHEGATPVPALVSSVSSRTLTLWAISPGYGGTDKQSVHHLTDPGVHEFPDWKRYGYWAHKPDDPRLAILSERVSLLEKKLSAIAPKKV
jgi:hypothetical protein